MTDHPQVWYFHLTNTPADMMHDERLTPFQTHAWQPPPEHPGYHLIHFL